MASRWLPETEVCIAYRNHRMLPNVQPLNCLLNEHGSKSGFFVLRYRIHQLVSTLSCCKLVSRPVCGTPATWLGGIIAATDQPGLARLQPEASELRHLLW